MNTRFVLISAALLALALAFVLWPLLRQALRQQQRRGLYALAVVLALGIPLLGAGIYRMVGDPAALDPAALKQPLSIDEAITRIKQSLDRDDADPQMWALLGQAYGAKNEPAKAADAFAHALKYKPDDADLLVAWAQADSMAQPQHLITGEARARLKRALAVDPTHQRGLWLLGISDFQLGRYADAVTTWTRLLKLLPPDSGVARGVADQVRLAAQRGHLQLSVAQARVLSAATAGTLAAAASSGPRITVHVSLAPALAQKLGNQTTLFVFARKPNGPPMPLAVARLPASDLPATVTLTNAMSMSPQLDLSSAQEVVIGARLSATGQALPQRGDLEGSSKPVRVEGHPSVDVVIDREVRG